MTEILDEIHSDHFRKWNGVVLLYGNKRYLFEVGFLVIVFPDGA